MKRRKSGTARPKWNSRKVAVKRVRPARASLKAEISASSDLQQELAEARERLTATSDILRAIAASPADAEGSLRKIAETSARLFGAVGVSFRIADGDAFKLSVGVGQGAEEVGTSLYADPAKRPTVGGRNLPGTVIRENRQIHLADLDHLDAEFADWPGPSVARRAGIRTMVGTPLRTGGGAIGALIVYRNVLQPFEPAELQLLQSFADQAVIAIENARLLTELRQRTDDLTESLEQQTATAEVLEVISRSAFDLQAVFETVVERSAKLSGADRARANIFRFDGGLLRLAATFNVPPDVREWLEQHPFPPGRQGGSARAALERRTIHIPDILADPEYSYGAKAVEPYRTVLGVPILKGDDLLGVLLIYLLEVKPFTDKQIAQVETFADQAAIAIENVRLFEAEQQRTKELTELLEQQAATADVLKVISRSTFDLQTVLDTLAESAARLCAADKGAIMQRDGEVYWTVALYGMSPEAVQYAKEHPLPGNRASAVGRAALEGRVIHIPDVLTDPEYRATGYQQTAGYRTALAVPLVCEGSTIGVFALLRDEVSPFTEQQIELVTTFADQAVIAIENVRLFEAEQQRTRELSESLEQQTATSEVLKVISSSPGDLQPVFAAMLEKAARICDATFGNISSWDGDAFHILATHNTPPGYAEARKRILNRPVPNTPMGRLVATKTLVHGSDLAAEPGYVEHRVPSLVAAVELVGARAFLYVPLLKDRELIGAFSLARRDVRPFSDKQIALVQSFADQAVIAIENARLFKAEQQRTHELTESLEQQTATSDVLRVISSSPGDLDPVFTSMLENAVRICGAAFGIIYRIEGGAPRVAATINVPPAFANARRAAPPTHGSKTITGRMLATKSVVHVADGAELEAYTKDREPSVVAAIELGGVRTVLAVPLLKDNELIGSFALYRQEVLPFTDKQIALVTSFASQAVIAIENARLLSELRELLEQQTATADVLRVISSSQGELGPVFQAMLENATRICSASFGTLLMYEGDEFRRVARHNMPQVFAADAARHLRPPFDGAPSLKQLVSTKRVVHITDMAAACPEDPIYALGGARSILVVPMIKDGALKGCINVYRREVRPFADKQIELLTNFAAQAVIAIENTRLLSELRESLEQQIATADVLRVISSSPGDLVPVFEAMLENAVRICGAKFGTVYRRDGEYLHLVASRNTPPALAEARKRNPHRNVKDNGLIGRMLATKSATQIEDAAASPRYLDRSDTAAVAAVDLGGARTCLAVPMLKDDDVVGSFTLMRDEVRPFTDKQIDLVANFASQAVIAIENARLLSELRESLQQQTATADILRVISQSPTDVQPIFDSIVLTAVRLLRCDLALVLLCNSTTITHAAVASPEGLRTEAGLPNIPIDPSANFPSRAILDKKMLHLPDWSLIDMPEHERRIHDMLGVNSAVYLPLLREGDCIGLLTLVGKRANNFGPAEIALAEIVPRPGADRHRKHATVPRAARVARTTNGDRRRAARHLKLSRRP